MDAATLFEREYERIRREAYADALPPFPGVRVEDRADVLAMTTVWETPRGPRLAPFILSSRLRGDELVIESARHETAHAAAILFDGDRGHGAAWRRHAVRCGTSAKPTRDGALSSIFNP